MKEEKLTNQMVIDINNAINGMSNNVGKHLLKGVLQFEDNSEGFSLTLIFMKLIDKISPVLKAWKHIIKEAKNDTDSISVDKRKSRQEKLADFLSSDSGIVIGDSDKVNLSEFKNLKGDDKPTGQLIKMLKPVLNLNK